MRPRLPPSRLYELWLQPGSLDSTALGYGDHHALDKIAKISFQVSILSYLRHLTRIFLKYASRAQF